MNRATRQPTPWKDWSLSLLALIYALPSWGYPFGNDQALHWYLGRRWLEGELPFVSGISSKPIGIFVIHGISTGVFGDGQWPIRVSEAITVILTGWLAAYVAHLQATPPADGRRGLGALAFAFAYYTYFDYWDTAHPELWEGALCLAAFVTAARVDTPWRREVATGALVGAAFMFKFPAALPGLGAAAWCGIRALRERPRPLSLVAAVMMAAVRFLAGAFAVFGVCVLPYLLAGQLGPMWEVLYDFILVYAEQANPTRGVPAWLRIERGGSLLVLTLTLTGVAFALATERHDRAGRERVGLLAVGSMLAVASVIVQGRYFGYHWVIVTPFVTALILLGTSQVWFPAAGPSWRFALLALVLVGLAFMAGPRWERPLEHSYVRHTRLLTAYLRGQISREAYLIPFKGRSSLDATLGLERVARRVRSVAKPGDTLCARGFATPLYQLTSLRCTSRHIVQEIVDTGLPSWPSEYRTALEKRAPTFLVTFTDRRTDLKYLERWGYHLLGTEGKFAIMTMRAP